MPDLGSISTAVTTATALGNIVLVTPEPVDYQPQSIPNADGSIPQQPEKFAFDYEGEQSVTLSSDITDHYIEDNTAIQNQIALRPVMFQTQGFIGELNDVPPIGLQTLKQIADKLTPLTAYAPELTVGGQIAYNNALSAYQAAQNLANNAVASWNTINRDAGASTITGQQVTEQSKNQTKQQKAFLKFFGYWNERRLFTLQTPWAIFKDMAILNVRAVQDAETNVITTFEVQFKQMRFAETLTVAVNGQQSTYNQRNMQGRSYNQGAPLTDLGTANLTEGPSLASALV